MNREIYEIMIKVLLNVISISNGLIVPIFPEKVKNSVMSLHLQMVLSLSLLVLLKAKRFVFKTK